jgi:hypothetical protein
VSEVALFWTGVISAMFPEATLMSKPPPTARPAVQVAVTVFGLFSSEALAVPGTLR